jgi:hypothetical protein
MARNPVSSRIATLCLLALQAAAATPQSDSGITPISPPNAQLTAPNALFEFETRQLDVSALRQIRSADPQLFLPANALSHTGAIAEKRRAARCKVFPGDASWPAEAAWKALNETLNGALIKTIPQAAPCYDGPAYSKASCDALTRSWTNSYSQYVLCPLRNKVFLGCVQA